MFNSIPNPFHAMGPGVPKNRQDSQTTSIELQNIADIGDETSTSCGSMGNHNVSQGDGINPHVNGINPHVKKRAAGLAVHGNQGQTPSSAVTNAAQNQALTGAGTQGQTPSSAVTNAAQNQALAGGTTFTPEDFSKLDGPSSYKLFHELNQICGEATKLCSQHFSQDNNIPQGADFQTHVLHEVLKVLGKNDDGEPFKNVALQAHYLLHASMQEAKAELKLIQPKADRPPLKDAVRDILFAKLDTLPKAEADILLDQLEAMQPFYDKISGHSTALSGSPKEILTRLRPASIKETVTHQIQRRAFQFMGLEGDAKISSISSGLKGAYADHTTLLGAHKAAPDLSTLLGDHGLSQGDLDTKLSQHWEKVLSSSDGKALLKELRKDRTDARPIHSLMAHFNMQLMRDHTPFGNPPVSSALLFKSLATQDNAGFSKCITDELKAQLGEGMDALVDNAYPAAIPLPLSTHPTATTDPILNGPTDLDDKLLLPPPVFFGPQPNPNKTDTDDDDDTSVTASSSGSTTSVSSSDDGDGDQGPSKKQTR